MVLRSAFGLTVMLSAPVVFAAEVDLRGEKPPENGIWMDQLDLSTMTTGFGKGASRTSVTGNPLSVGGASYAHGVGTHADSEVTFALPPGAESFVADVGVDDELECMSGMDAPAKAAVKFRAYVDGKLVADSGVMKFGQVKRLTANLQGGKELRLEVKKEKGARFNHVDWAGAAFIMKPGSGAPEPVAKAKDDKAPGADAKRASLGKDDLAIVRGQAPPNTVWVQSLQLRKGKYVAADKIAGGKTPEGKPLTLAGETYDRGFAVQGETELHIRLDGGARRFVARVGIDTARSCGKANSGGAVLVGVWADGKQVIDTGLVHGYDKPIDVAVDLAGVKKLVLVSRLADGGPVTTTWAGAALVMNAKAPAPVIEAQAEEPRPVIARSRPNELGIHGPIVVGASPGKPFLFRIPATGKRPLTYAADTLPAGLTLDAQSGIITGKAPKAGTHRMLLKVKDAAGAETQRPLTIETAPNKLALTPPMGWNSWNVWGLDVADDKIRRAADALVSSGLADHGFAYVNIDDAWEGERDSKGEIQTNKKFPDMKALSDYVHGKGLKLGIYSSPGPKTCGEYEGSYKHEAQDARTYAKWGIDLLKYDWCSYGTVAKGSDRPSLMKPYIVMSKALRASGRDVVYSLCQYGMGNVWEWGKEAGGHYWRTTGDIVDTWGSVDSIGFGQAGKERYAGPGGWNDPDMLVVGNVGWSANVRPTRLTPAEQVTHVTLWSLLAAPLLLGNDLEKLDEWTTDLLTNDEVLDVNQDPLGKAGARVYGEASEEVWARALADGTQAVAVFNRSPTPRKVSIDLAQLKFAGKQPVRDLWRRQDLGTHDGKVQVDVLPHGSVLLKIGEPKRS